MSLGTVVIALLLLLNLAITLVLVLRRPPKAETKTETHEDVPTPTISRASMDKLQKSAESAFEDAVIHATAKFGEDLADTSKQMNQLISRLTTDVVEKELEHYRQSLTQAREAALQSLNQMQLSVEKREAALQGDLDAELVKRRQYLMQRLDQKLGEAVSAYIVESLGQGADLGAQRSFLLASLERHKADLVKDLADGK